MHRMDKINLKLNRIKNHVARQKAAYAFGAVAIGAIALQQRNLKSFYEFLEEEGIDPIKFTCPEYFAEMNA